MRSTFCVLPETHEAELCVSLTEDVLEAGKKNPEEQEDLTGYQDLQGTGTESRQKDTGK